MMISVIVPVYNSEKYLHRCINSIINQTYANWELLAIDDGSTDNSLSILKEYYDNDKRIKIFHQENAGPGSARNVGIENATGDYIVFVDSDDILSVDYFEKLSKKKEDVVYIDINQVDESLNLIKTEYMSDKRALSKDSFLRWQMTGKIEWGGVRKAVKRDLLERYSIRFSSHKIGEEAVFSFFVLYYAKSKSFIESPVYTYVNRSGSQSDCILEDPWGPVAIELKKRIKEINKYDIFANTINSFFITSEIVALDRCSSESNLFSFRSNSKKIVSKYKTLIDEESGIDYTSLSKKVIVVYPFLKSRLMEIIYIMCVIKKKLKSRRLVCI